MQRILTVGFIALSMLVVEGVALASTPGQNCQSSKNREAGKYANCMAKAEAKLLKTRGTCALLTTAGCYADADCGPAGPCTKDLTKYGTTVTRCGDKFETKWLRLTQAAADALDPCPDGLLAEEIKEAVDEHVANVAAGLAGEGLSDCGGELLSCEGDLTVCDADLTVCGTDRTVCEGELTTCEGELTTCDADLATALECGDGDIDPGEDCEQGNLNGGTCSAVGAFAGGVLRCGVGCSYDTSDCYAVRFVDNGDGTISDRVTGLMWEKKSDDGTIHDMDNAYTWTSTGTAPDGSAFATFLGTLNGSANGTCFAGHCDWRLPMIAELEGLLVPAEANPSIDPFFKTPCPPGCEVTSPVCSCTKALDYWSATTAQGNPSSAWGVAFTGGGHVFGNLKTAIYFVRAVRSGS